MTVRSNFVTQGGTVTVTLNVKNNASVPNVSPADLAVERRRRHVHRPDPGERHRPERRRRPELRLVLHARRPGRVHLQRRRRRRRRQTLARGELRERAVRFGRRPERRHLEPRQQHRRRRPARRSPAATPPGSTASAAQTTTTTFQKYDIAGALVGEGRRAGNVAKGGALTTDGARDDLRARRQRTQGFNAYDIADQRLDGEGEHGHQRRRRRRARLPERRRDEVRLRADGQRHGSSGATTSPPTRGRDGGRARQRQEGRRADHRRHEHLRAARATQKSSAATTSPPTPGRRWHQIAGQHQLGRRADPRRRLHLRPDRRRQQEQALPLRHRRQHVDARWQRAGAT